MSLSELNIHNIGSAIAFFGNGYLFRYALISKRGGRLEPEIHTIALAVVASVGLYATFQIINFPYPWFVAKEWEQGVFLLTRLAASYMLGFLWAALPSLGAVKGLGWTKAFTGTGSGQTLPRFLQESRNRYVHFELVNDAEFLAKVKYFDKDPERFNDIHLCLVFVHTWNDNDLSWVSDDNSDMRLISVSQIRKMTIMK